MNFLKMFRIKISYHILNYCKTGATFSSTVYAINETYKSASQLANQTQTISQQITLQFY